VCLSEREKFVVMISARCPRPCFEFPDGVDFGLQPVRANASEAFLLRNTGKADGRFVLSVPAPFSVTPSDGALKAGGAMQLTFDFKPELCGEYAEELLIEYDSGERCFARLAGASSDVEVGLERSLLVLEPCYISLLSQTTLKLHNRSDVKVHFSWKALRSAAEDEQRRTDGLTPSTTQLARCPLTRCARSGGSSRRTRSLLRTPSSQSSRSRARSSPTRTASLPSPSARRTRVRLP